MRTVASAFAKKDSGSLSLNKRIELRTFGLTPSDWKMVLKEPKLQTYFGYKDVRDNVEKALDGTGNKGEGMKEEEKGCDEKLVIIHTG